MKQGKLFWNEYERRIGILYEDGSSEDGLHCGETMQAWVNGEWIPTRIEYRHGEDGGWYLIDCYAPGAIPAGLLIRR